jgi:hypothetical protein
MREDTGESTAIGYSQLPGQVLIRFALRPVAHEFHSKRGNLFFEQGNGPNQRVLAFHGRESRYTDDIGAIVRRKGWQAGQRISQGLVENETLTGRHAVDSLGVPGGCL